MTDRPVGSELHLVSSIGTQDEILGSKYLPISVFFEYINLIAITTTLGEIIFEYLYTCIFVVTNLNTEFSK